MKQADGRYVGLAGCRVLPHKAQRVDWVDERDPYGKAKDVKRSTFFRIQDLELYQQGRWGSLRERISSAEWYRQMYSDLQTVKCLPQKQVDFEA